MQSLDSFFSSTQPTHTLSRESINYATQVDTRRQTLWIVTQRRKLYLAGTYNVSRHLAVPTHRWMHTRRVHLIAPQWCQKSHKDSNYVTLLKRPTLKLWISFQTVFHLCMKQQPSNEGPIAIYNNGEFTLVTFWRYSRRDVTDSVHILMLGGKVYFNTTFFTKFNLKRFGKTYRHFSLNYTVYTSCHLQLYRYQTTKLCNTSLLPLCQQSSPTHQQQYSSSHSLQHSHPLLYLKERIKLVTAL